jgi:hypothetical protein
MGNLTPLSKHSRRKGPDKCHCTDGNVGVVEQLVRFLERLQNMRTLRLNPRPRKVLHVSITQDGPERYLTLL